MANALKLPANVDPVLSRSIFLILLSVHCLHYACESSSMQDFVAAGADERSSIELPVPDALAGGIYSVDTSVLLALADHILHDCWGCHGLIIPETAYPMAEDHELPQSRPGKLS
jgi:hypothetical protein